MGRTLKKGWLVPALLVAALSTGCSGDFDVFGSEEPQATATVTENADAEAPQRYERRFVRASAPACGSVWRQGRRLPVNYEWCTDKNGGAVAGPRIGSCEVVSYDERLYATPGYRIRAVVGDMSQDPRFHRALTACKRQVAPAGAR